MEQETIEEAAERIYGTDMDSYRGGIVRDQNFDLKRGFIKGAKFQAERIYSEKQMDDAYDKGFKDATERMYSEEDMKQFAEWLIKVNFNYTSNITDMLLTWKEQFKKK